VSYFHFVIALFKNIYTGLVVEVFQSAESLFQTPQRYLTIGTAKLFDPWSKFSLKLFPYSG